MAGRQLQRLLKQQLPNDPLPNEPEDGSEEESEEEEEEAPRQPAFNPFSLLTDDEDASKDGEKDTSSSESEDSRVPSPTANQKPSSTSGGAAAPKRGNRPQPSSNNNKKNNKAQHEEEDIDAILQELNITPSVLQPSGTTAGGASSTAGGGGDRPLLAVNPRHLKADEELKRMFGKDVVSSHGADDGGGDAFAGASRRVRRLAARGLIVRHQLRPGLIITPRDTWPRLDSSSALGMEAAGAAPDGRPLFKYTFPPAYHAVQDAYEECQATFDPNAIAALLQSHPYHPDALLTMADLYRSMGEHSAADDSVERCLYALESAWSPSFIAAVTTGGGARMTYNDESAPLFLALFRYIASLGRRGLHRTALEVCKMLLSLDEDDPVGALLVLDYYAVRSGQYTFLQRFVEGYGGGDGAAALLPNMTYSLALAKWYEEQEQGKSGHSGSKASGSKQGSSSGSGNTNSNTKTSSAATPSSSSSDTTRSSSDLLTKALLLHPLVVIRLQDKLRDKGVGGGLEWVAALTSPPFINATDGGSAGLSHLIDIFVERQHLMWKAGPVQDWLLSAVKRVVAATAAGDPSSLPDGVAASDWTGVREQAFPPSEANPYRHLRLHEFSDSNPRLPAEEVHGMAGAIPVGEGVEVLQAELQRLRAEGLEQLQATHPLMALLRSLLPWVADGEQPDYAAEEGQQGGGQQ